ncbi:MAG TPA: tyrosine-type recombinase/integrase [Ktedonobacteraceae bacterium]|nr:tyrosine-type recombinase/integrase [Ktedonobacteraceae bacterium]
MNDAFDVPEEGQRAVPNPYQERGVIVNDLEQVTRLNWLIEEWLLEKYRQTQSVKTRETYRSILLQYRAALQQQGLDLDRVDCLAALVTTARLYSTFSARGKEVKVATSNLRLAVLSSFYEFAQRNDLLDVNPIDKIKRGKTRRYQGAHALQPEIVQARLRSIDTGTLAGQRDRALLLVYLQTCRRLSEVASLLWRDVRIERRPDQQELVTLTFERCKGAKRMVDQLPAGVSQVLLTWVRNYYAEAQIPLTPDAPLWVALAAGGHNGKNRGNQLGTQAIADICKKYLGTSKVHTTRHTGTLLRLKAGATVQDIKKQLGHDSLATTDYYIEVLLQGPDLYAEQVEEFLL